MKNYISRNCLLSIAIVACFVLSTCSAREAEEEASKNWQFGLEYHVHVINGFKKNTKPLMVHCWSKQDDIGQHSLNVDQEITWHFKVRFDGTTLFICDVKQGEHAKHFDAFDAQVEGSKCAEFGKCYWLVAEGGFYFSTDNFTWFKQYDW
ncbi:hypothetical protein MIMGU_mgv1a026584mg [Erythranthe guttata]|uniref:S-protein homolog n=1 Tax=Erythranthe guttata TaxID=4155 RepID=A0A022RXT8_ERYGU|nr:PREDICTED: uncharacterized protein LOC105950639 [Erythranthe guttata]EYU43800.1 hypothetical protein MIMGU_mgv1a026584mg [Erythranthe guttata]|eukprot:XP_012829462.1 PREDICTED: uncharacterized protein LOC105950639 [Erythranthe guttata]